MVGIYFFTLPTGRKKEKLFKVLKGNQAPVTKLLKQNMRVSTNSKVHNLFSLVYICFCVHQNLGKVA